MHARSLKAAAILLLASFLLGACAGAYVGGDLGPDPARDSRQAPR